MLTIQWTVISAILYTEIVIILLLLLPWVRPTMWKKIFDSRLVVKFKRFSRYYSYAYIFVLLLLFFDATREVRKYSEMEVHLDASHVANADSLVHMRLFRAQRNLYICGFALLLFLAIKRLVTLLARSANLEVAAEAAFNKDIDTHNVVLETDDESRTAFEEEKKKLMEKIKNLESSRDKLNNKAVNLQEEMDSATLTKRQNRRNSGSRGDH